MNFLSPARPGRRPRHASDVVQSVCRELLEQHPHFTWRGPEAFRAWLFQWAPHKIQDRTKYHRADMRKARRGVSADDAGDIASLYASVGSPSAHAIAREHVALLERALDRLDPEGRQVISLCRIAGLSRDEAAVLGTSTGACACS